MFIHEYDLLETVLKNFSPIKRIIIFLNNYKNRKIGMKYVVLDIHKHLK